MNSFYIDQGRRFLLTRRVSWTSKHHPGVPLSIHRNKTEKEAHRAVNDKTPRDWGCGEGGWCTMKSHNVHERRRGCSVLALSLHFQVHSRASVIKALQAQLRPSLQHLNDARTRRDSTPALAGTIAAIPSFRYSNAHCLPASRWRRMERRGSNHGVAQVNTTAQTSVRKRTEEECMTSETHPIGV
jgi:hypothetical protein